jgi:tripartite ATP-independent transporter DctP family solute receptor
MTSFPTKLERSVAALAVCLLLALLPVVARAAETLRVAGTLPADHLSTAAMESFKREVEKRTVGEFAIEIVPAAKEGPVTPVVERLRAGELLMTWTTVDELARSVPELQVLILPFLFPDRETAFRIVDGPTARVIDNALRRRDLVPLGFMDLGASHVTNSVRPIMALSDFKGLRIGVPPTETHLAAFRALGAEPVAVDPGEVYPALKEGRLDGQESPYTLVLGRKLEEVQSYLSGVAPFYDLIIVVADRRGFEALPPEHREHIRSATRNAIGWQRGAAAAAEEAAREELLERGMQFDPVPPEAIAELRRATAGVIEAVKSRIDPALVQAVLAGAN